MKQLILILLLILSFTSNGIFDVLFSAGRGEEDYDQIGSLQEFFYSPGYSDMTGGVHNERLVKNDDGTWVIISRHSENHSDPTIVTTYAVSAEAVEQFERFLKEKGVPGLSNREDSDLFATDYSPWRLSMDFMDASGVWREYDIYEYKEYSDQDYELIREVNRQFAGLYGEVLSEVEED